MKVILLKELKGKGGEGDVVEVARGFAVNYLFPQEIAIPASKGNLKQLEQRKHNIEKREAGRISDANDLQAALEGKAIRVIAKVGEEGQLFGSVTPAAIAEAVQEQLGVEIDRRKIDLKSAIKTAGTHEALVSIYRDIKASVTVEVGDEAFFAAADAGEEEAPEDMAEAVVEALVSEDAAVEAAEAEIEAAQEAVEALEEAAEAVAEVVEEVVEAVEEAVEAE